MKNFIFSNPTRIIFGKGAIADLPKFIPNTSDILMTYGCGSIKKNGVYDQIRKALAGFNMYEFGGIESNPSYETCMKAVEMVRKKAVNFLLAVGGGSVLDATKFIALAACYTASHDPWDFIIGRKTGPSKAIPIGTVVTIPAAGSENNSGLIISRESTREKKAYSSYEVYPKFSILDPETSYSLSPQQTANGIVDTFVHVTEQYMTYPADAPLQDRQAEALLATLIEEGPKALADPHNYEVRATLMWCATQAQSGVISRGVPQDWATHAIGHEITAMYGLDHAATVAIVLFGVWENQMANKKTKLAQYGRRIWNLQGNDNIVAASAIVKTETFFQQIGVPTRFSSYHLNAADVAQNISQKFSARGIKGIGEQQSVGIDEIQTILVSRT